MKKENEKKRKQFLKFGILCEKLFSALYTEPTFFY